EGCLEISRRSSPNVFKWLTSPMDGSHSLLIRLDSSLALRCRKGAIHPIFDHLVGGDEQLIRHGDAEHTRDGKPNACKSATGIHATPASPHEDVPAAVVIAFVGASFHGQYYVRNIKGRY